MPCRRKLPHNPKETRCSSEMGRCAAPEKVAEVNDLDPTRSCISAKPEPPNPLKNGASTVATCVLAAPSHPSHCNRVRLVTLKPSFIPEAAGLMDIGDKALRDICKSCCAVLTPHTSMKAHRLRARCRLRCRFKKVIAGRFGVPSSLGTVSETSFWCRPHRSKWQQEVAGHSKSLATC